MNIIKPIIDADGYYAICPMCEHTDLEIFKDCPNCNQHIDWSWIEYIKKLDK